MRQDQFEAMVRLMEAISAQNTDGNAGRQEQLARMRAKAQVAAREAFVGEGGL